MILQRISQSSAVSAVKDFLIEKVMPPVIGLLVVNLSWGYIMTGPSDRPYLLEWNPATQHALVYFLCIMAVVVFVLHFFAPEVVRWREAHETRLQQLLLIGGFAFAAFIVWAVIETGLWRPTNPFSNELEHAMFGFFTLVAIVIYHARYPQPKRYLAWLFRPIPFKDSWRSTHDGKAKRSARRNARQADRQLSRADVQPRIMSEPDDDDEPPAPPPPARQSPPVQAQSWLPPTARPGPMPGPQSPFSPPVGRPAPPQRPSVTLGADSD